MDKPQLRSVNLSARYAVFTDVPEGFLIGYGLGPSRSQHTNLPDLCVITEGEDSASVVRFSLAPILNGSRQEEIGP